MKTVPVSISSTRFRYACSERVQIDEVRPYRESLIRARASASSLTCARGPKNLAQHSDAAEIVRVGREGIRNQEREREEPTFMMPNTGPNVSSDMTFISCVTFTSTCGATYVVPSFASGKSDSGMSAWAPFETAGGRAGRQAGRRAGSHRFIGSVSYVSAFGRGPKVRDLFERQELPSGTRERERR